MEHNPQVPKSQRQKLVQPAAHSVALRHTPSGPAFRLGDDLISLHLSSFVMSQIISPHSQTVRGHRPLVSGGTDSDMMGQTILNLGVRGGPDTVPGEKPGLLWQQLSVVQHCIQFAFPVTDVYTGGLMQLVTFATFALLALNLAETSSRLCGTRERTCSVACGRVT